MPKVILTNSAIKNKLKEKGFKYPSAICEYIWNSLDAEATHVKIISVCNQLGGIESITISDNGIGIIDPKSFEPIFESAKKKDFSATKTASLPHGKYGFGRLTFSIFAEEAIWTTVYRDEQTEKNYKYTISVKSNNLTDWNDTERTETEEKTGTSVIFNRIHSDIGDDIDEDLADYIKSEFAWFLELNSRKGYTIKINEKNVDYSSTISFSTSLEEHTLEKYKLEVKFILWNHKLNEEYSRFYLLDSKNNEKFTSTTTLNNKGDDFFHSIYVKSELFDNMDNLQLYENPIFESSEQGIAYKKLKKFIDSYLRDRRRPFIVKAADKLVNEFDAKGVFPTFRDDDEFDLYRKEALHTVTKQLYQVEPKIFRSLNLDQKKIFVRLLETIMRSGEKDKIFDVLKEVLSLESSELEQLGNILKSSKLSNVIKTIQLIEDRYRAVEYLKSLVYKREYNADEPNHIQKLVEKRQFKDEMQHLEIFA
ncbi:ATP-binding protein [Pseudanabaena galeata UHCC 0370]|uniref:ATP-binding protein n=1 Tax=Pseudanabaena galeata UHCC 0370 TaxID=3110310 RepID=A0ABU5TIM0_9CYAN|nr:ATP-binding protein [Pseudanabaena galeata]MEA5478035.1 ATP-binding protein [Pseudanabaena galeata UHCC 0370]